MGTAGMRGHRSQGPRVYRGRRDGAQGRPAGARAPEMSALRPKEWLDPAEPWTGRFQNRPGRSHRPHRPVGKNNEIQGPEIRSHRAWRSPGPQGLQEIRVLLVHGEYRGSRVPGPVGTTGPRGEAGPTGTTGPAGTPDADQPDPRNQAQPERSHRLTGAAGSGAAGQPNHRPRRSDRASRGHRHDREPPVQPDTGTTGATGPAGPQARQTTGPARPQARPKPEPQGHDQPEPPVPQGMFASFITFTGVWNNAQRMMGGCRYHRKHCTDRFHHALRLLQDTTAYPIRYHPCWRMPVICR